MKHLFLLGLLSLGAMASESDLNKTVINDRTYPAAIVAEKYGKKSNLKDFETFFESADSICYNGAATDALVVANLIYDDIWIYDEYTLYNIGLVGDAINFDVLDLFSYEDQNASEDELYEYVLTYTARPCN